MPVDVLRAAGRVHDRELLAQVRELLQERVAVLPVRLRPQVGVGAKDLHRYRPIIFAM
jgi:hypothetical protein